MSVHLSNNIGTVNNPLGDCLQTIPSLAFDPNQLVIDVSPDAAGSGWVQFGMLVCADDDYGQLLFSINSPMGSDMDNGDNGSFYIDLVNVQNITNSCCSLAESFTLVPGGTADNLIANGFLEPAATSASTPQFLYITDDIVFDNDVATYTFATGSELVFAPGVEMAIEDGAKVEIRGSTLSGCEEMWKGVTVRAESQLAFFTNIISDAQYAIQIEDDCTIDIIGNQFYNNYIGIYKPAMGASTAINQPFPIYLNFFATTSSLLPPFEGQFPEPGEVGFAGAFVEDCRFIEFGRESDLLGATVFSNLKNGILAFQSGIKVHRAQISSLDGDFNATTIANPPLEGLGVAIFDGRLTIVNRSSFDGMVRAIHLEGTSVDKGTPSIFLKGNEAGNIEDGIVIINSAFGPINILDNQFFFHQYGILLQDAFSTFQSYVIKDNELGMVAEGPGYPIRAGIRVSNNPFVADNREKSILDNTINIQDEKGCGSCVALGS
ncbi:MAG: hypothetical protein H6559_15980 [Lewinellaceae bacterium]|nr:hypothetical protein [Lewinellaceae bacterium]